MRHLKKYNESIDFEFDEEYIRQCFIEFFDDPDLYDVLEEADITNEYIEHGLNITCPDLEIMEDYSIEEFIETGEKLVDFYKEIDTCIEKVKIKYPDVRVVVLQDNVSSGVIDPANGTRFIWVKFRMMKTKSH